MKKNVIGMSLPCYMQILTTPYYRTLTLKKTVS